MQVDAWRTGGIRYGIYEAGPGLPFVLSDVGGIRFEASINLRRPAGAEAMQEALIWPELTGDTITYVLIDPHTNLVHGLRLLKANPRFVEALRCSTATQLRQYVSDSEIDRALAAAEGIPLEAMLQLTVMYSAGTR